jgi:hypothetical protein
VRLEQLLETDDLLARSGRFADALHRQLEVGFDVGGAARLDQSQADLA